MRALYWSSSCSCWAGRASLDVRSALRAFRRYVGDLEQDVGDPRRGPAKRLTIGALAGVSSVDVLNSRVARTPSRA